MNVEEKQRRLKEFVLAIRPDIEVIFETNKKWTSTFASAAGWHKCIRFTPLLFKHTIESCFCCGLHELAHIVQWERLRSTRHDKQFAAIRDELMQLYGTPEIAAANKEKRSKSMSEYIIDKE